MKSTVLKEKRSTHLKRYGLLYLLFVVAIAVFVYRVQNSVVSHSGSSVNGSFEVGSLAPKFILRNLKGNLEGIDDYKDKVIIVNFCATWCAPCIEEMPAFDKLSRIYRSHGLPVLSVSLDKADISQV